MKRPDDITNARGYDLGSWHGHFAYTATIIVLSTKDINMCTSM